MTTDRVLIVDDEESVRWVLKKALEKDGLETVLAKDAAEAFERLQDGNIAVVLMDIRMPGMSGLNAFEKVRKEGRNVSVIIMTAHSTMQNAIEAMRRGAYDYITKPFDLDEVNILVRKALEVRHLSQEVDTLRAEVREKYEGGLVGGTPAMQEIYKTIGRVVLPGDELVGGQVFTVLAEPRLARSDGRTETREPVTARRRRPRTGGKLASEVIGTKGAP